MTELKNTRVLLARRPSGEPLDDDFSIETIDVPEPKDGEVVVQLQWLSLDPYMRGRMSAAKSYAASTEIGELMGGGAVSEVLHSNTAGFAAGGAVC